VQHVARMQSSRGVGSQVHTTSHVGISGMTKSTTALLKCAWPHPRAPHNSGVAHPVARH
jgi:hypothetical protein